MLQQKMEVGTHKTCNNFNCVLVLQESRMRGGDHLVPEEGRLCAGAAAPPGPPPAPSAPPASPAPSAPTAHELDGGDGGDDGGDATVECPVCMCRPSSIHCCQRCHNMVCGECLPRLRACPSCREDFCARPPSRNVFAERALLYSSN